MGQSKPARRPGVSARVWALLARGVRPWGGSTGLSSPGHFILPLGMAFLFSVLALAGRAGDLYLRQKGPGPLRFGPPSSMSKAAPWTPPSAHSTGSNTVTQTSAPVSTNSSMPVSSETPADASTNRPFEDVVLLADPPAPMAALTPEPGGENPAGPFPGPRLISPRALADLLAPSTGSTNGPNFNPTVPENFWFLPPMPHLPLSSQAIYQVK